VRLNAVLRYTTPPYAVIEMYSFERGTTFEQVTEKVADAIIARGQFHAIEVASPLLEMEDFFGIDLSDNYYSKVDNGLPGQIVNRVRAAKAQAG